MSMNYQPPPPQTTSNLKTVGLALGLFVGIPMLLCGIGGVAVCGFVAFPSAASKQAKARSAWQDVIKEKRKVAENRANRELQVRAQRGTVGPEPGGGLLPVLADLQDNQRIKEMTERTEWMYGPIPPDLRDELHAPAKVE
jgi:hypothetical protein